MKKIILFLITVLTVISSLLLLVSARDNEDYEYVLEFENSKKVYPIMDSLENAIGFSEYYGSNNVNLSVYPDEANEMTMRILLINGMLSLETFRVDGSRPNITYTLPNPQNYTDAGFCYINGVSYIFGVTKNGKVPITSTDVMWVDEGSKFDLSFYVTDRNNIREGKLVEFPFNPIDDVEKPLMENILDGLKEFISGFGNAFAKAFTSVFMKDGRLNVLSYVLLSFFGITLGYGCIRYVTGTFRKET